MAEPLSRREFLQRSTLAGGALAAAGGGTATAEQGGPAEKPAAQADGPATAGRPNILFIMTDQQRADCVGANGNRIIQTPNLDRLAAESANFTRAFVQSPVCTPSRACYFTGRYAHAHRNRVNYTPLDDDEILLPARLQSAGYRTALVGKLHLYYRYPPTREEAARMGFDEVELHDGVPFTDPWSDYARWRGRHDPLREIHYRRTAASVARLRTDLPADANPFRAAIEDQYTDTTWTGRRTRHWLRQLAGGEKPFFLFSSFFKPHSPFEVPRPLDAMYNDRDIPLPRPQTRESIERLPEPLVKLILRGKKPPFDMDRRRLEWAYRSYYASISQIDREVGLTLQTLEETGQAEQTIVVFCSDHGDQLLEHGLMGKNCFFEASVRVPLMIRLPGRVRRGQYDALVETVDVLPTLFDLAGLATPYNVEGRSLGPLVCQTGEAYRARDAVFSENVIPEVITSGSLDFSFEKGRGIKGILHPDAKMVRTDRWKYNHYPGYAGELYDLENDPHEEVNLVAQARCRSVLEEMKGRILEWLITAGEADQIARRWCIP